MNYHYKSTEYPILSDNTRLVKMKGCCALIDRIYGSYVLLEAHAAAIIAMCNGAVSTQKLLSIAADFLPVLPQKANEIVFETLEKAREYLYYTTEPQKIPWRYNPTMFLYETIKHQDNLLHPLEKPLQMTLVLTNECNFECIYCFRSAKDKWNNELTTEEIFDLIDQAAALDIKYCSLTGGEPTLHPDFEKVVLRLLEKDIYPYISTNGTNLLASTLQKLRKAGLQTIQFSMDSAEPLIFDKMVGAGNYFNKLIGSIKVAKELDYVVRIKGVLTELNAATIDSLFKTCAELKVNYIFLEPFSPGLDGRGNQNLILSPDSAAMVEKTIEKANNLYAPETTIMPFKPQTKWAGPDEIIYCGGMYTSFILQSDGTIGVCEQANHPSLTFGNIREKKLVDIWNSQAVIDFLNPPTSNVKEPCLSCEEFTKCRSGCFNFSLQYTDDLFAPDPRCWKVNKIHKDPLNLSI
jgi:pyrroloquinoline quinone biosynthesis protein E